MLNVNYAECHKQANYAECLCAECRYAECRYAECRGALYQHRSYLVDFRYVQMLKCYCLVVQNRVGPNVITLFTSVIYEYL
jgi:hypothetical protein